MPVPYALRPQTDFARPNSSGATVKARVTKDDARDPSRWHAIFPGSNTTLDKLLRYTYYIMRSVIRYICIGELN